MFNVVTTKSPLFEGGILVKMWNESNEFSFLYKKGDPDIIGFYETVRQVFGNKNYDHVKNIMEITVNQPIHVSALAGQIPGIHEKAKHPVTGEEHEIFWIIMDLNDTRGYTRGQIADWLETLDNLPKFKVDDFNPVNDQPKPGSKEIF